MWEDEQDVVSRLEESINETKERVSETNTRIQLLETDFKLVKDQSSIKILYILIVVLSFFAGYLLKQANSVESRLENMEVNRWTNQTTLKLK